MKYGYKGAKLEELIENYTISQDKIIIQYLDGSIYEVPFTEKQEIHLLQKMLEQAQSRNESDALYDAKKASTKIVALLLLQSYLSMISNLHITDAKDAILTGIMGAVFITGGMIGKDRLDEIRELEKYSIYLSRKETFEKHSSDPNVYKGIKAKQKVLNINTLDNYSLKDIKKIQNNLKNTI